MGRYARVSRGLEIREAEYKNGVCHGKATISYLNRMRANRKFSKQSKDKIPF